MLKENFKNKGITLLSLILTVIIMLILTGAALSIALGENGIIDKANEAVEATQIATDKELLLSAAIGAMGNDGKVNLSAMVLPEGFTGSNGTYTCEDGHTFTVSENGDIVYTGSDDVIQNGDGVQTETVDLNGKYYLYQDMVESEEYLEIIDNSLLRWHLFELSDDTEDIQEWELIAINEENSTYEFMFEQEGSGGTTEEKIEWPYVIVKENSKIVNKVLFFDGFPYFQNMNGISFALSGEYISQDGTRKIEFIQDEIGPGYYIKSGDSWENDKINNQYVYVKIGDKYYLNNGDIMEVSEDLSTITMSGITWTKQ